MKRRYSFHSLILVLFLFLGLFTHRVSCQSLKANPALDEKVKTFLEAHRWSWSDANVPESDGRVLYDLILEHRYKKALEIGTSTGHSAIWIAWALSKTGGKLITIEINERRYRKALAHFEEAGLSETIDARLADAHELVPKLEGPFDFVFCDADKGWYTNYFKAVLPKLEVGGCFAAHNVSERRGRHRGGTGGFYDYVTSLPNVETTIDPSSRAGISVSYKMSDE